MLALPEIGMRDSRATHNCDLQIFCDWVEGCMLFKEQTRLSRTALLDVLCEEEIYDDQSFASAWLDEVWNELERRERLLGKGRVYQVNSRSVTRERTWFQAPAYAFCILVPLLQHSSRWKRRYSKSNLSKLYAKQGLLFERISDESLKSAGWFTHRAAWSSRHAARLPSVVASVAQALREPEHTNWPMDVSPNANEVGLDIVFFQPFVDARCGYPVYLTQCASGNDWDSKLHTPDTKKWQRMVNFAAPPHKAFTLPHSLGEAEMRRTTVSVKGMVLDRYRLHDSSRPASWCSADLSKELRAFLKPLIAKLPDHS